MLVDFDTKDDIICPVFDGPVADRDSHTLRQGPLAWHVQVLHRDGNLKSGHYGILITCRVIVDNENRLVAHEYGTYIYPREHPDTGKLLAQEATRIIFREGYVAVSRALRGDKLIVSPSGSKRLVRMGESDSPASLAPKSKWGNPNFRSEANRPSRARELGGMGNGRRVTQTERTPYPASSYSGGGNYGFTPRRKAEPKPKSVMTGKLSAVVDREITDMQNKKDDNNE